MNQIHTLGEGCSVILHAIFADWHVISPFARHRHTPILAVYSHSHACTPFFFVAIIYYILYYRTMYTLLYTLLNGQKVRIIAIGTPVRLSGLLSLYILYLPPHFMTLA